MKACDWPFPFVEIQCDHCGRFGRYTKATFIEIVGAETDLPTARREIAIDCPVWRRNPDQMRSECKPQFVQDWWEG